MKNKEIYLDNSATTKVLNSVINAMVNTMSIDYGNPESLHKKGFEAQKLMDNARKDIAKEIACHESEIYFTSGATESNNLAIFGSVYAKQRRGNKIITTSIEHPSVLECFEHLKTKGFVVEYIAPNKDGDYNPIDFYNAVDDKTIFVSAMMVNNELGTILPIVEIAKAVKKKNKDVIFHVDAVQGFMRLPIKLKNTDIDLLSASGHKINAPKGVGCLYVKKGVRLIPLFYGGGQQNNLRVGTQSPPLAVALATAVKENSTAMKDNMAHYTVLRDYFYKKANECDFIKINKKENTVPYIISISVDRLKSEVLLHFLEEYNIFVSSGSACSKGAKSHVLTAMGFSQMDIDTSLRISFSKENTTQDLDELFDALNLANNKLVKLK